MSFAAYDPSTDLGKVRLLLTDTRADMAQFQDEEIQAFLDMTNQNLFLAAAMGLDTLAANEALVQKRIETLSLKTDGPAVAKALRELANSYRERVDKDSGFETVEINSGGWSAQQIYENSILRQGGF